MSILVVGSIALDSVETQFGSADNALGGSALYFSAAASTLAPVNVVGVVGSDFPVAEIGFLKQRRCDFEGMAVEDGETFRWGGRYHANGNQRDTLFTHLNVFEHFKPIIPEHYRHSRFLFLANIQPGLQLRVLDQMERPELTLLDTMNFWISGQRDTLMEVIRRIDILVVNDQELEQLTGEHNPFVAARGLLAEGPRALIIKKGEHGSVLVDREGYFIAPAFPVSRVVDPTGAGDSFAGGMLGYLATCETVSRDDIRMAMVYGSVVASFTVEDFSMNRLRALDRPTVEGRIDSLREMTRF